MAKKTAKPKKSAPNVEMIEVEVESGRETHGKGQETHGKGRETHGKGQSTHGKISKSDAVRQAIADGVDNPVDGIAYIKSKFGIDIGATHFSAVKSSDKKRASTPKGKPGRKPKTMNAAPKRSPKGGEGELLAAMEAMKPLVDSLGVESVKRIAELLG